MLLAAVLAAALLAVVPAARADGGGGGDDRVELRREARCSASSRATLRVRAEDGRISVEVEIEARRKRAPWAVMLLHERRVVFAGRLRASASRGSLKLRRSVDDWFGPDAVVVRATGSAGESCRLSLIVPEEGP
jgi:hypothetical protein